MEFLTSTLLSFDKQWFTDHFGMIILSGAVFVEWVALQILVVHYNMFRESLKRPTPDGIRFNTLEKVLSFQASQIDRLLGKMKDFEREIDLLASQKSNQQKTQTSQGQTSFENSFLSLGEINLKKRLQEMSKNTLETVEENKTSSSLN